MNITILFSTPTDRLVNTQTSIADEDTRLAAQEIAEVLTNLGHIISLFPVDVHSLASVATIKADCIFNLIEWTAGDLTYAAKVYEYLDISGIPYTGCGWTGYITSSEKILMKKKFQTLKIPSPNHIIVPYDRIKLVVNGLKSITYPLIVKLASDHCSLGLDHNSIVYTLDALTSQVRLLMDAFHDDILVEEFIQGREFQITVLEKDGHPYMLPPVEIIFEHPEELNLLTFQGKWDEQHPDYNLTDMDVAKNCSESVLKQMKEISIQAFRDFQLHDYARFDVRLRGEDLYVLEVNANPGLDNSLSCGITLAASINGMSFADLINSILTSCLYRTNSQYTFSLQV